VLPLATEIEASIPQFPDLLPSPPEASLEEGFITHELQTSPDPLGKAAS
jgi:hypothetical protein